MPPFAPFGWPSLPSSGMGPSAGGPALGAPYVEPWRPACPVTGDDSPGARRYLSSPGVRMASRRSSPPEGLGFCGTDAVPSLDPWRDLSSNRPNFLVSCVTVLSCSETNLALSGRFSSSGVGRSTTCPGGWTDSTSFFSSSALRASSCFSSSATIWRAAASSSMPTSIDSCSPPRAASACWRSAFRGA